MLISPTLINQITDFSIETNMDGSDHAPITVSFDMKDIRPFTETSLSERASSLGVTYHDQNDITPRKCLNHHQVCTTRFSNLMNVTNTPVLNYEGIHCVTETTKESEEIIMNIAKLCKKGQKPRIINDNISYWERLITGNDSKSIWHAIDWKGQYNNLQQTGSNPSDLQFKRHFETLLNNEN